jgi:ADP-ribose pyrophosphatase YjhB (NUDIX family)
MQGKKLRVRVGVIAVHEGKILLARQHLAQGQDFWIVPGGGLKKGEGLLDCARREMAEETGLQIEPIQLLYVGDFFKGDRHVVDTFWLGRIVGGELRRREDEIDNLHFFDISQLNEIEIRPPSLAEHVLTGFREGFRSAAVYLGKYTKDNRSPEPTVGES